MDANGLANLLVSGYLILHVDAQNEELTPDQWSIRAKTSRRWGEMDGHSNP